jgi:hypothetical protein
MAEVVDARARLAGRRTSLIPLEAVHYGALRRVELGADLAYRWRHHGRHEAPEHFAESLWSSSVANFLVGSERHDGPVGITSLYNLDLATGSCYLAAARFTHGMELGPRIIGAVALTLDYAFDCWPLRKVHMEVPEYNFHQIARITQDLAVVEAKFEKHVFLKGQYWDLNIVTVWRDKWSELSSRYLRFA